MDTFIHQEFPHLLAQWGYVAILLAVLADSFGIPVPGEIMLIIASVYAGATHHLALPFVTAAAVFGAVLGDNTTYWLGRRGGYPLLRRHGHVLHLGQRRLKIGEYLFRRYGGPVVGAGRLLPVLHIWTAVLAGVNRMPWLRFALTNAVGALVWASVLSIAGYMFGRAVLHLGWVVAGAGIPLALVVAAGSILLLKLNERRLYAQVIQSENAGDDREARTGTG